MHAMNVMWTRNKNGYVTTILNTKLFPQLNTYTFDQNLVDLIKQWTIDNKHLVDLIKQPTIDNQHMAENIDELTN